MHDGKNSDVAVAILAAAIMGQNTQMDAAGAVRAARDALGAGVRAAISPDEMAASVRRDKIQCLEDGTWHTMLRRYIARKYNMTPAQYRTKWGLPDDYPLVAPEYAARRAAIAKNTGLGRK